MFKEYSALILQEIEAALQMVDASSVDAFADQLIAAKNVFALQSDVAISLEAL